MRGLPSIALGSLMALSLPLASALAATPGEGVLHSPAQTGLPVVQADWNGGYGGGWHHHYYHHWHHEWRNDYNPRWHHYWHHHYAPPPYGY